MTVKAEPVKVFYSYAHEDKDWREKLANSVVRKAGVRQEHFCTLCVVNISEGFAES